MNYFARLICVMCLICGLVLTSFCLYPDTVDADTTVTPYTTILAGQQEHVYIATDSSITLTTDALPAPRIYGLYTRFGYVISQAQQFPSSVLAVKVDYSATIPQDSIAYIDVRGSTQGTEWTSWEVDVAQGDTITFEHPVRFVQYRATLLSNGQDPVVRSVRLIPRYNAAVYTAFNEVVLPVAPTYRVHATRMGLVGGRTANGHIIQPRDRFVSLPSIRSLSSKGGSEYMVRITYNGKSSVAPVYDVGPWNIHDNYWDEQREKFNDLARGWPQDHAAYYDGYNNGVAEKGRVRFPTAVDVGDGVWWDDLGIHGDQAVIDITFLWLGSDPIEAPQEPPVTVEPTTPAPISEEPATPVEPVPVEPTPVPEAPATGDETAVEQEAEPVAETEAPVEPAPTESPTAPVTEETVPDVGDADAGETKATDSDEVVAPTDEVESTVPAPREVAPSAEPVSAPTELLVDDQDELFREQAKVTWYTADSCGHADRALWTYTTTDTTLGENVGHWDVSPAIDGLYDVYVFVPDCATDKPVTESAHYVVQHRDGATEIVIDQAAAVGDWVFLGQFPFGQGVEGYIELRDVAGDSMHTVWFDAIKLTPVL
ncbi:MAG: hypothetical protein GFH27_549279n161 [Chloroflexi bacterium AL-W]|nr:hypothetical protein [Chloroflexi bacterium AL-N1]NOK65127.1 hypothetical protein [Chloroflexi bacterium AL-N10]NOK72606.1 hypothetical protein [Chloroflexi bacterium AL-N5]NOK79306.1 hypothetical protein [Chloroflexi bacterium AL-W]NOK87222.1 hypothetical protein [Chloroflexi bacterium AL-N15]